MWERRAPLSPRHVESLVKQGIKVLVQPSTHRVYPMSEYVKVGAEETSNIEKADVILGMQECMCIINLASIPIIDGC